jgi:glycosyltransferase involved in cell wall biosynthesis
MKFYVVTPCWNSGALIAETVRSVAEQTVLSNPDVTLEYVVVDGGSSDDTVEHARKAWQDHPRATFRVISEPDQGMYDALVKGFRGAEGDVFSYINAGDLYSRHGLAVARTCFTEFGVSWLTGMRVLYNDDGVVISAKIPFSYSRDLVRAGHYGVRGKGAGAIQQESTFWSRELMESIDLDRLAGFRLAGDLFLWTEFARSAELDVVAAHLGGFRFHGGHLSDAMDAYKAEARTFLEEGSTTGYLRAPAQEVLSWLPVKVRSSLPGRHPVIAWNRVTETWERLN